MFKINLKEDFILLCDAACAVLLTQYFFLLIVNFFSGWGAQG